jgi:GDPmannose 4,6-dehydratase
MAAAAREGPQPVTASSNRGQRTAVVTGVAGQDGSYLAELLLGHGYRVVGVRRPQTDPWRIAHLREVIELVEADLLDEDALVGMLEHHRPDEIYNLAGHSFVPSSWDRPDFVGEATGLGTVRLLEAIKRVDRSIRFYQASSSEIFGNALEAPQRESTPPNPRNPYGAAKAFAHFAAGNARAHDGLFAVSGILFNHESPRRGLEFISRKITFGAAQVAVGISEGVTLGSLDAQRDWGYAGDYVRAMWLMLQRDEPADYVVASGVLHTVRDICKVAFGHVGMDYRNHVRFDSAFARPTEAVPLVGDASKAREELGWEPTVSFESLITMMVDADLERSRGSVGANHHPR